MEIAPFVPTFEPQTFWEMFSTWQLIIVALFLIALVATVTVKKLSSGSDLPVCAYGPTIILGLLFFAVSLWNFLDFVYQKQDQVSNQRENYVKEQTENLENNGFTILDGTFPTNFKEDGGKPDSTQIKLSTSESLFDCVVSYPNDITENLRFQCAQNETFDLEEIKGK